MFGAYLGIYNVLCLVVLHLAYRQNDYSYGMTSGFGAGLGFSFTPLAHV